MLIRVLECYAPSYLLWLAAVGVGTFAGGLLVTALIMVAWGLGSFGHWLDTYGLEKHDPSG